ncbi:MAG: hypothetical protein U0350_44365 [Caldilineaceae bacterium]
MPGIAPTAESPGPHDRQLDQLVGRMWTARSQRLVQALDPLASIPWPARQKQEPDRNAHQRNGLANQPSVDTKKKELVQGGSYAAKVRKPSRSMLRNG